jgi:hypothetical protein
MATDSTEVHLRPAGATNAPVGLIANGSAGSWDVAVDQTVAGYERWFLQLDSPSFDVYVLIQGPHIVENVLTFLERHQAPLAHVAGSQALQHDVEIDVGSFDGSLVRFLWDEEGEGRLVIVISATDHCTLRYTASASDVRDLTEAFRQIRDDLAEEGLET